MEEGWILGITDNTRLNFIEVSSRAMTLFFTCIWILFLSSCATIPKIIVLHDPLSVDEHITLGLGYESKGEYDYAIQEYTKALKKDRKDHRPLFYMGNVYYKKGEYGPAEKYYKKASRIAADNGDIQNNLAWVYIDTARLEEARGVIEGALRIKRDPYYMDTLANIYDKMGKYKEAIGLLQEAINITPPEATDLLYNEYKLMGDLYDKLGEGDLAKKFREKGEEYRKDIQ